MLISPSIYTGAESSVYLAEIFTFSEKINGDNFKYADRKAEMRLIRVEDENGATIIMYSHPLPLLGHIEIGELTHAEKTGISKTF